jgi:ABC-2 type transport system ATP-binding protein
VGVVDHDAFADLPGVVAVDRRSDTVLLSCSDSDSAIRALLDACPGARDIEIESAGLEGAFLELTRGENLAAGEAPGAAR